MCMCVCVFYIGMYVCMYVCFCEFSICARTVVVEFMMWSYVRMDVHMCVCAWKVGVRVCDGERIYV